MNFNTGGNKLTFTIDSDATRTVTIDATDIGIIRRYQEATAGIEQVLLKADSAEGIIEAEDAIMKAVDDTFNADVSSKVFKGVSPFQMVEGKMLYERFMEWVFAQMKPEIQKEYKKFSANVKKYTSQLNALPKGKKK